MRRFSMVILVDTGGRIPRAFMLAEKPLKHGLTTDFSES